MAEQPKSDLLMKKRDVASENGDARTAGSGSAEGCLASTPGAVAVTGGRRMGRKKTSQRDPDPQQVPPAATTFLTAPSTTTVPGAAAVTGGRRMGRKKSSQPDSNAQTVPQAATTFLTTTKTTTTVPGAAAATGGRRMGRKCEKTGQPSSIKATTMDSSNATATTMDSSTDSATILTTSTVPGAAAVNGGRRMGRKCNKTEEPSSTRSTTMDASTDTATTINTSSATADVGVAGTGGRHMGKKPNILDKTDVAVQPIVSATNVATRIMLAEQQRQQAEQNHDERHKEVQDILEDTETETFLTSVPNKNDDEAAAPDGLVGQVTCDGLAAGEGKPATVERIVSYIDDHHEEIAQEDAPFATEESSESLLERPTEASMPAEAPRTVDVSQESDVSPEIHNPENPVVAHLVDEEDIENRRSEIREELIADAPLATEVMPKTFWQKNKLGFLVLSLVVIVLIIVLVITLPNKEPAPLTGFPYLVELLSSVSGREVLLDESTPQNKALKWLAFEDESGIPHEAAMARNLTDRYVVALTYFAMGGMAWIDDLSFLSNASVCEWPPATEGESGFLNGVRCDSVGSVNYLRIANNNMTGTIISELASLESLQSLSMRSNGIEGPLPESLGSLPQLEVLDFAYNFISGSIPNRYGGMDALRTVFLFKNSITGTIPSTLPKIAGLEDLQLQTNMISGTIPDFLRRSALEIVRLNNNVLQGTIPESLILQQNSLEWLDLSSNMLSGTLPTSIDYLPVLRELYLDGNSLSGIVPTNLRNLGNLEFLVLNGNSFNGAIPSELGILEKLKELNLAANALSGTIPSSLSAATELEHLDLHSNQLTGTVATEFGALEKLRLGFIGLQNNSLVGSVEEVFCNEKMFPPPRNLAADCNEIVCPCCTDCCDDATGSCEVKVDQICNLAAPQFEGMASSVNADCKCSSEGFDLTCQVPACQTCNPEGTACLGNYSFGIDYTEYGSDHLWRCHMEIPAQNSRASAGIIEWNTNFMTTECTIEIDGVMCNSCLRQVCNDGIGGYRVDCSNIEEGSIYDDCDTSVDGGKLLWFLSPQYYVQECFPCYMYN